MCAVLYIQSESENMKIKMKIKLLQDFKQKNKSSQDENRRNETRGHMSLSMILTDYDRINDIVLITDSDSDPVPWGETKPNQNKFQNQSQNLINANFSIYSMPSFHFMFFLFIRSC